MVVKVKEKFEKTRNYKKMMNLNIIIYEEGEIIRYHDRILSTFSYHNSMYKNVWINFLTRKSLSITLFEVETFQKCNGQAITFANV